MKPELKPKVTHIEPFIQREIKIKQKSKIKKIWESVSLKKFRDERKRRAWTRAWYDKDDTIAVKKNGIIQLEHEKKDIERAYEARLGVRPVFKSDDF